jgi:hypothetical protein
MALLPYSTAARAFLQYDLFKTKALLLLFPKGEQPLSSAFHGKFFRHSQATENLTSGKRPRGLEHSYL